SSLHGTHQAAQKLTQVTRPPPTASRASRGTAPCAAARDTSCGKGLRAEACRGSHRERGGFPSDGAWAFAVPGLAVAGLAVAGLSADPAATTTAWLRARGAVVAGFSPSSQPPSNDGASR